MGSPRQYGGEEKYLIKVATHFLVFISLSWHPSFLEIKPNAEDIIDSPSQLALAEAAVGH